MTGEFEDYCIKHSDKELPVLQQLTRETYNNILNPRMISGHLQGLFLKFITSLAKPENILEIGTFTGYSAISMAEGLLHGCTIHSIEINDEVAAFTKSFLSKNGYLDRINIHIGDACEIIQTLDIKFDMVFIDGNKRDYVKYYNTVFDKVKKGGLIIADNVLWDGHVLDEERCKTDAQTKGIAEFNDLIVQDNRVEKLMLPLRDGLLLIRKL